jgi:hypothetical protein
MQVSLNRTTRQKRKSLQNRKSETKGTERRPHRIDVNLKLISKCITEQETPQIKSREMIKSKENEMTEQTDNDCEK